jgi:hypothetical protein
MLAEAFAGKVYVPTRIAHSYTSPVCVHTYTLEIFELFLTIFLRPCVLL